MTNDNNFVGITFPPELCARRPWRPLVQGALQNLGGQASLRELYAAIEKAAPGNCTGRHWKAKVRQVVQLDPDVERVAKGVWRLRSHGASSASPTSPSE
jgi:hypothetical protein